MAAKNLSVYRGSVCSEALRRLPDSASFSASRLLPRYLRRVPYERFKDEAEFREKFVKPLLNRLGYYGVSEQHGTQEFGKDFVFSELHRLGGMRHYAAQVKPQERIKQGTSVDVLLSQVRQAFTKPFKRAVSLESATFQRYTC